MLLTRSTGGLTSIAMTLPSQTDFIASAGRFANGAPSTCSSPSSTTGGNIPWTPELARTFRHSSPVRWIARSAREMLLDTQKKGIHRSSISTLRNSIGSGGGFVPASSGKPSQSTLPSGVVILIFFQRARASGVAPSATWPWAWALFV